jgi:hypothetical protein
MYNEEYCHCWNEKHGGDILGVHFNDETLDGCGGYITKKYLESIKNRKR